MGVDGAGGQERFCRRFDDIVSGKMEFILLTSMELNVVAFSYRKMLLAKSLEKQGDNTTFNAWVGEEKSGVTVTGIDFPTLRCLHHTSTE